MPRVIPPQNLKRYDRSVADNAAPPPGQARAGSTSAVHTATVLPLPKMPEAAILAAQSTRNRGNVDCKRRGVMERPRIQQKIPEDRSGWHRIDTGPHLEILFHPNRLPAGREPDQIERPSIVVAVAGKREQALRSTLSAWAPIITSGRASPIRFRFRSRRGKARSMPR